MSLSVARQVRRQSSLEALGSAAADVESAPHKRLSLGGDRLDGHAPCAENRSSGPWSGSVGIAAYISRRSAPVLDQARADALLAMGLPRNGLAVRRLHRRPAASRIPPACPLAGPPRLDHSGADLARSVAASSRVMRAFSWACRCRPRAARLARAPRIHGKYRSPSDCGVTAPSPPAAAARPRSMLIAEAQHSSCVPSPVLGNRGGFLVSEGAVFAANMSTHAEPSPSRGSRAPSRTCRMRRAHAITFRISPSSADTPPRSACLGMVVTRCDVTKQRQFSVIGMDGPASAATHRQLTRPVVEARLARGGPG